METKFGETIRKARRSADLTLGMLAEGLGISPGYLSDMEQGRKPPPATELVAKLAEALHLGLNELVLIAAEDRKEFKLPAQRTSTKHLEVGAALERQWTSLDDAQLTVILQALGKG